MSLHKWQFNHFWQPYWTSPEPCSAKRRTSPSYAAAKEALFPFTAFSITHSSMTTLCRIENMTKVLRALIRQDQDPGLGKVVCMYLLLFSIQKQTGLRGDVCWWAHSSAGEGTLFRKPISTPDSRLPPLLITIKRHTVSWIAVCSSGNQIWYGFPIKYSFHLHCSIFFLFLFKPTLSFSLPSSCLDIKAHRLLKGEDDVFVVKSFSSPSWIHYPSQIHSLCRFNKVKSKHITQNVAAGCRLNWNAHTTCQTSIINQKTKLKLPRLVD